MSEREKLLEIVKKNINLKGIVGDLMLELLEPALDRVVEKSDNPFDNMAKAALYPIFEAEIKKLLEEKIDEILN